MNLSQIIQEINTLSDEEELPEVIVGFVNDAVARINIERDSNFPYLDLNTPDVEYPLPEKWVRALLIPFGVGRVKQRDSSQFEYSDAYAEFMENLMTFQAKYNVPEEYKDATAQPYDHEPDIYEKPTFPWWRW